MNNTGSDPKKFFCRRQRVGLGRVRRCSRQNTEVKQSKMSSWNVYGVFEHLFRSHRVTVSMYDRKFWFYHSLSLNWPLNDLNIQILNNSFFGNYPTT